MARSPISLLLLKRLSHSFNPQNRHLLKPLDLCTSKPFSTSPQQNPSTPELPSSPKPSSLSSRLSFVFDEIDAIEKLRAEQDQTLQRIRAWRQSKHTHQETVAAQHNAKVESEESAGIDANSHPTELTNSAQSANLKKEKGLVELVHPWPEWIELMERLVQHNYFDHRRRDEDKMVRELGIDVSDVVGGGEDVGIAFNDFKTVQTACVNFGKDRFDILRSLSRHDIQILVGHGCPSTDRKVVFSGKLLRKRVHLDEGDVCSSCSLRNMCEKAFLLTNKEDEARMVDIMRVLFMYGFDPLNGSVANKDLLKQKSVKTVIRKLLHEIVKLSTVPIDPDLPPPVIKKPPPKVKQPPPPPKKRVGRDDVEMKKGDWLCPKCDFLNFAKNTACLQCDAKRPKRQLLPGEWECPECNFLNYRRNMACFHCDCKRPPDEFIENKAQERQHSMRLGTEKAVKRQDISNAWNFNFDDDESDGADVAAFEYADSIQMNKDSPLGNLADAGHLRGYDDDFSRSRRPQRVNMRENSDSGRSSRPGIGFNDFDDEDDIDSYEIDTEKDKNFQSTSSASYYNFSEVEGLSESEDNNLHARCRAKSNLYSDRNKARTRKPAFSDDDELGFDTDDEASITPKWKSSHVASGRSNRSKGPSKKLSFGSDEEFGLDSDMDDCDDLSKSFNPGKRSRGGFNSKGGSFLASDSDDGDDDDLDSSTNRSRGNRRETHGSRGRMKNRSNAFSDDDFNRPSRGSRGNSRRFQQDNNEGWGKMKSRGSDSRNRFERSNKRGFGNRRYDKDRNNEDTDHGEFRNSRRVIER